MFPDQLADSELGEIPEGWKVRTLGTICNRPQYGYTASADQDQTNPKFLRITDINKRTWIEWEAVPHCVISEEDLEKYYLRSGDILIARMADPGHGCLIEEDKNAVFASYLIRFRPISDNHGRLLQYWMRSEKYWQLVRERGTGTTRTSLNANVLSEFPLVVPPDRLSVAFTQHAEKIRNYVVGKVNESQYLAEIRDSLLPQLIVGAIEPG